ncbi:MAG: NifU family protein [Bacilli bacterium]|jgi:Fe-S cluster biogenesis protein NfuA|nr:NifU family protein [Bacilli bacterium]
MKKKNIDNENLETEQIREIINQLRPYLNSDGGDIEFVKYEEEYVYVKLYGACASCIFQDFTIQDNIYEAIKEVVPNCKGVINIEL